MVHIELQRRIRQVRLCQLWCQEVYFRSELPGSVSKVCFNAGGDQRLSALPADHQDALRELTDSFSVDDAEHQAQRSLLPQAQLDPVRSEFSFVMVAVFFNETDCRVRPSLVEEPPFVFKPVYDYLIQHLDPFSDGNAAVLDLLVV